MGKNDGSQLTGDGEDFHPPPRDGQMGVCGVKDPKRAHDRAKSEKGDEGVDVGVRLR